MWEQAKSESDVLLASGHGSGLAETSQASEPLWLTAAGLPRVYCRIRSPLHLPRRGCQNVSRRCSVFHLRELQPRYAAWCKSLLAEQIEFGHLHNPQLMLGEEFCMRSTHTEQAENPFPSKPLRHERFSKLVGGCRTGFAAARPGCGRRIACGAG